jgi:hypothetical protein
MRTLTRYFRIYSARSYTLTNKIRRFVPDLLEVLLTDDSGCSEAPACFRRKRFQPYETGQLNPLTLASIPPLNPMNPRPLLQVQIEDYKSYVPKCFNNAIVIAWDLSRLDLHPRVASHRIASHHTA